MFELVKYIYENYPNLKNQIPLWQLFSLLDKNEDKIIVVKEGDKFKGAGLYIKLTDNTLEDLKLISENATRTEMTQFLSTPVNIQRLLDEKGGNVHFLFVLADSLTIIRKGLKEVIKKENPKNVSWFDIKTYKIKVFKGARELCLN